MKKNNFKNNLWLKICIIITLVGTLKILMDFKIPNITPQELRCIQIGLMYFYGMVFLIYISFHNKYKKTGIFLGAFLFLHICIYLHGKTGWQQYELNTVYGDVFIINEDCDFGFPTKRYDYSVYDKKSKRLLGKVNLENKLIIQEDSINTIKNDNKNIKYIYTIDKTITITKDINNKLKMHSLQ